jgi:hypothetical protein
VYNSVQTWGPDFYRLPPAVFFVVRMLVTPGPIVPLLFAVLLAVFAIFSALLGQIIPVRAVLAIIPIVVARRVAIENADWDAGFLRRGTCKRDGRGYK